MNGGIRKWRAGYSEGQEDDATSRHCCRDAVSALTRQHAHDCDVINLRRTELTHQSCLVLTRCTIPGTSTTYRIGRVRHQVGHHYDTPFCH